MNTNGLAKFAKQVINKYRQAGDVVHVRMSDDNVTNRPPLGFVQGDANAARIDGYAIVDHKAGQALRGIRAALRIKGTW